jgi:hypothetical protein
MADLSWTLPAQTAKWVARTHKLLCELFEVVAQAQMLPEELHP